MLLKDLSPAVVVVAAVPMVGEVFAAPVGYSTTLFADAKSAGDVVSEVVEHADAAAPILKMAAPFPGMLSSFGGSLAETAAIDAAAALLLRPPGGNLRWRA